jgi:3'5'-cyclic nucleotide phosphodiesterase
MLSRVTSTEKSREKLEKDREQEMTSASKMRSGYKDYTNDITDCALTQFSVVYAALIHDCDHAGVSNDQLVKEGARIAEIYKNKSVAENHSFNLAFDFLMQPEFEDLLSCICGTENPEAELERFCCIVQNAVLATDVFDKDIKAERDARWLSVFGELDIDEDSEFLNYQRAQVVLEHMIQASDVIHTMQHVSGPKTSLTLFAW